MQPWKKQSLLYPSIESAKFKNALMVLLKSQKTAAIK